MSAGALLTLESVSSAGRMKNERASVLRLDNVNADRLCGRRLATVASGRGRILDLLQANREGILMECLQEHEGFTPCLRHHGGAWAGCNLIFCLDCGKDIKRDCD